MFKYNFFDVSTLYPKPRLAEGGLLFLGWVILPALFVVVTRFLSRFREVQYYDSAIAEGVGPHLWNVIGVFAFMFFGVALVFPRTMWLAKFASHTLISVFCIGSLMIGILLGELLALYDTNYISEWRNWLQGVGVFALFALVACMNSIAWHLGSLVHRDDDLTPFMTEVARQPRIYRLIAAVFFGLLPVALLWYAKPA